jgi:hypothetical protein
LQDSLRAVNKIDVVKSKLWSRFGEIAVFLFYYPGEKEGGDCLMMDAGGLLLARSSLQIKSSQLIRAKKE